jgi:Zn-dependent protease with chaperone function
VIVGALYTVYAVNCESSLMKVQGIRRPSRREAAMLQPIVDACAASLRMSATPSLMIDDDRSPNAFAWTRHIVIHVGLLEPFQYDRETVSGVICHELAHWNSGDSIARTFLQGVALPLYLSYSVLTAIPRVVNQSFVRVLVWLFTWPIMLATRYVIIPLQTSDERRNEYRADQAAMLAGQSPGLRRVLAYFRQSFDGSRNGWVQAICATHPPNELRLEALELPGIVYELPDKDSAGPAGHPDIGSGSSVVRD